MKFCLVILFSFFFSQHVLSQKKVLREELEKGNYYSVINQVDSILPFTNSNNEKFELYELKAEAYLSLYYFAKYLKTIRKAHKYNPNKTTAEINYNIELAMYYHGELRGDSSTFFAHQAMVLFLQKKEVIIDSNFLCKLYRNYGNIMRNGYGYLKKLYDFSSSNKTSKIIESRINILTPFFDTALSFASSNYQKIDIYRKNATMLLDAVAGNQVDSLQVRINAFYASNKLYQKAISLTKNKIVKAACYSLTALNYHYLYKYREADSIYKIAEKYVNKKNKNNLYEYITIQNWRGWNLEEWYEASGNIEQLHLANNIYKKSVNTWHKYYSINKDTRKGLNDGYRVSSLSRIASCSFELFKKTKDSSSIYQAFDFAEKSKYATFKSKATTIKEIQSLLDNNTAFIHYTHRPRPSKHTVFIILKNNYIVTTTQGGFQITNSAILKEMYGFSDFQKFKKWNYVFYTSLFLKVDSILTKNNIRNAIISNSDECSTLNFDVLISDSLANNWKDQPYLFHKYNFSYALSGRSFVDSYKKEAKKSSSFGLTLGNYQTETNLLFSTKLSGYLNGNYIINQSDFENNITQNNVSMVLLHGNSDYTKQNGEVLLNSSKSIIANSIFKKKLRNDLVILSSCNTNASRQSSGEGATGSFSKAFRYAGSKSVLTTSWEIDDKTNAFIMKKFIEYLSDGLPKNEALWQAKKDYWNQAEQDEQFNPLYWAPYVLTGNIEPVQIDKRELFNLNWLWFLLVLPIGYFSWRKIQKAP